MKEEVSRLVAVVYSVWLEYSIRIMSDEVLLNCYGHK